ncbi:hypothetical protein ABZP36_015560 [Zizania latifolia]
MSSNSTMVFTGEAAGASSCCGTTTLFGALVASFTLSFFLVFIFLCLCYLHLGRRRRNQILLFLQDQQQQPLPQRHGLDAAAIALIRSFPYLRAHGGETTASVECAVCLNAVDEGEMARQLPGCGHVFHQECIDVWLSSNASCPVCRGKAEPAAAAARAATMSVIVPVEMLDDETVAAASATSGAVSAPPERFSARESGQETETWDCNSS